MNELKDSVHVYKTFTGVRIRIGDSLEEDNFLDISIGDTVYDIVKCSDEIYRAFRMKVKDISEYGSFKIY